MEGTMPIVMIMEGTRPKPCRIGGHPAPDGASPTQPYKCGQNVKVKVKIKIQCGFRF